METAVRHPADSVTPAAAASVGEQLQRWSSQPWAYDYFAVMRRLEALAPASARWGRALLPGAESVRVGQEPSLAFAPASFSRFEAATATSPPRLAQMFFGYLGPNGPLPLHLSDFIRERALNHGDVTWLAFLDQFSHRFSLHFYRAWAQARPAVALDRPGEDRFRQHVGALIGTGTAARSGRDEIHDDARLHFCGWLVRRVRNAESIEAVLHAYFGIPVRLERWVGHWLRLPAAELTTLRSRRHGDAACMLGRGALLGGRAWDRQHKIRLHLGPLTLAQYLLFLPIGSARPVLERWMQQLIGGELAWDAQLVLRREEVPVTRLGAGRGNAPRLGWVSWLGQRPRAHDAADVRIDEGAVRMPTAETSLTETIHE